MKPWSRINTYIIGIFIAWLYLAAKDSKFSTKAYDVINSALKSVYIRYIVYILGFLLLNYCLFVYEVFNTDYKNVTRLMTVLYISLSRSGFVLGMMMIIYPVMIGHGKPLLSVLGYQLFNSIAKYTYGIYMLHLLIFAFYIYTTVQGIEFSALFLLTRSGDIFMSGILLGLLGTLMFDSPLLNIEKIYLFPEAPRRQITMSQEMKTLVNK
jgi:peptidoglycan/LPS O-acetylase OafA/YrhL